MFPPTCVLIYHNPLCPHTVLHNHRIIICIQEKGYNLNTLIENQETNHSPIEQMNCEYKYHSMI